MSATDIQGGTAPVTARLLAWCVVLALAGLFTANPLLWAFGVAVLPPIVALLWRPGEPPILLFALALQWLQVFTPIIQASASGEPLGGKLDLPEMQTAGYLGIATILVLAIGMRVGVGGKRSTTTMAAPVPGPTPHWQRLLISYAATLALSIAAWDIADLAPSATQVVITLARLRSVVLFLVFVYAGTNRAARRLAWALLVFEIVYGFSGFFSGFKGVLFLVVLANLSRRGKRIRILTPATAAFAVLSAALILFWQTIKPDYRNFLNKGSREQEILVTNSEKFAFLSEYVDTLDADSWTRGLDTSIDRIGYLEYFARSIKMVPSKIPHQDGRLWGEIVPHVLLPRFLYPDKRSINDSDRTNEFTGIQVANASEGASIGIGYAAESYIDFGPFLMFIPIFGLGLFFGYGYRWLQAQSPVALGTSFGVVFVLSLATLFEASSIKMIGGGLLTLIIFGALLRFVGSAYWSFLCVGNESYPHTDVTAQRGR